MEPKGEVGEKKKKEKFTAGAKEEKKWMWHS